MVVWLAKIMTVSGIEEYAVYYYDVVIQLYTNSLLTRQNMLC